MKKIKKLEKIILMLVVIAIICGISTVNKATGNVDDILPTDIPVVKNTTTENTSANTIETQNVATNNTASTALPKTGVNDTAMWVLVAGCVVLAIYTYKKVRDYNV